MADISNQTAGAQASRERWDRQQQSEREAAARRQAANHEQELFHERVQRRREAQLRGETPAVAIPTFEAIMAEKREVEKAAAAEAEAARLAALTPRDIWMSTLSWQEQEKVRRWQAINPGLEYPMPGLAK